MDKGDSRHPEADRCQGWGEIYFLGRSMDHDRDTGAGSEHLSSQLIVFIEWDALTHGAR